LLLLPQRYIFSSKSQLTIYQIVLIFVVVATTKVHIFKQITTDVKAVRPMSVLLLLPQRYIFSSKSQLSMERTLNDHSCCCYHKGTYFQANHNVINAEKTNEQLLLLPQRYIFSSKSQLHLLISVSRLSCCCYHKGTYFQANHNWS